MTTETTLTQYETVSKFDRRVSGLLNGNNLHTKPTTIRNVGVIEVGTFSVQTIRVSGCDSKDQGDHVAIEYTSKDGLMQMVLPPKVVDTIIRQHNALSKKNKTNASKAAIKARKLAGEDLGRGLREWREKQQGGNRGR